MTTLHRDGKILEEVVEIARHIHNRGIWLSAAAAPSGEDHVADVDIPTTSFVADAGSNTWGSWLQVVGATDTPVVAGMVKFEPHLMFIDTFEAANTVYMVQIAAGATGAAALMAGTYSTFPFKAPANARTVAIPVLAHRYAAGTKVWVRCWARLTETATMNFMIGIHEYKA